MAIITSGTPIRKVLSGGTPITKVISNGTVIWTSVVMITITIPTITGIATQTLKIGSTTIYSGAGGTTVQVEQGSSVTISATEATNYEAPTITTPVTANSNFSTATYITAGRRIWSYFAQITAGAMGYQDIDISGLLTNKATEIQWTIMTDSLPYPPGGGDTGYKEGTGTISSTTDFITCAITSPTPSPMRANCKLSIISNGKLRVDVVIKGASVAALLVSGEIRQ